MAAPEASEQALVLAPEEALRLTGQKILVVEDDVRNLYAIMSVLGRNNVQVIAASSAREAYAQLSENPDTAVVLMDIMMPEIDGYQATREIRAMPQFASLPIIALTAKASASDRRLAMEAGCNDHLSKPADTRQLISVILRCLPRTRAASTGEPES
jgi:CheY-like chemotaxis protein